MMNELRNLRGYSFMTNIDNNVLNTVEYGSMAAGACLMNVQEILSVVFLVISILIGIVNFIMLIKKFKADGKIDEEEQKELEEELLKLRQQLNEASTRLKERSNDDNNNRN